MRYTKDHCGVYVIPKKHLQDAIKKLARYEDLEELKDIKDMTRGLRKAAEAKQKSDPAGASIMKQAVMIIITMYDAMGAEAVLLREKLTNQKERALAILDDVDGQITDDPVALARERLEKML